MAVPEFPPSELEAGKISLLKLGNIFKISTEEKHGFLKKVFYAGVPVIAITFAELLIFGGRLKEASIVYTLLLLAFSFSIAVTKNRRYAKSTRHFCFCQFFAW